jgi:hypothetical protein
MKKGILTLMLTLLAALSVVAQEKSPASNVELQYQKDSNGLYYVLIPVSESLIDQTKGELEAFNTQRGLAEKRITRLKMEDGKNGIINLLVIRRFENKVETEAYVQTLHENTLFSKHNAMAISGLNYRTLLMKKDLATYRAFIKS